MGMNTSTTNTTMPTITKSTIIWRSPVEGKEELRPAMEIKKPREREKKLRKREKKLGRKKGRRGSKTGKIERVESAIWGRMAKRGTTRNARKARSAKIKR